MPIGAIVTGGIAAAGAIGGGLLASGAAKSAANTQSQSAQAALNQQNQQFDRTQANYAPFLAAGTNALGQQGDLVGINGAGPQQGAIDQLRNSPYYQSLFNNGQNTLLANASATGGLRGGDTQRSLAQFGTDTLSSAIQNQINNLSGITTIGANAAGGLGTLGQNNANAASGLINRAGDAQASGALGSAGAISGGINNALKYLPSSIFGGGSTPIYNSGQLGGFDNGFSFGQSASPYLSGASSIGGIGLGGSGYQAPSSSFGRF